MAMPFNPTVELTEDEVKALISDHLDHGGEFIISKHAKDRMSEREYNYRDIRHIIYEGTLINTEFNRAVLNWKYTIHGDDLDGDKGTVVVAIAKINEIVIITLLSS
ncbi:MAG: DUF4258 domain-containing protein [Deltaproteobacteria bacterium]|nr:DUF4258 domain-containing protein [Deltaproteobacteria bacterium]